MIRIASQALGGRRVDALKRRLPAPVLGALRQLYARTYHRLAWPGRPLAHTLASGVRVDVTSVADWALYNEIFVDGEYDAALDLLDQSPHRTRWILDLGANAGYFTLRVADRCRRRERTSETEFRIVAVEGAPPTFARLAANLRQPLLAAASAHCALVGRRTGAGYISLSAHSGMNSIVDRHSYSRAQVPFVDVQTLLPADARVALLKCDIEGAEQLFVESYADLLERVDAAVFEFHHRLVDVERCRELLRCAGLCGPTVLRQYDGASVELFTRSAPLT